MRNELRQRIQAELADAFASGAAAQEALAGADCLLTSAEMLLLRLGLKQRKQARKRRKR
jgi:hypothetical protein